MAIFELFSSSFLFSIITIILLGVFFSYVNYKIYEQDHKISSMIGLISTLAEEMREVKHIVNNNEEGTSVNISDTMQFNPQFLGGNSNLIEVSDNEEEDEDSDDGEDEDEDSDDGEDEEEDSDNEDSDIDDGEDIDIEDIDIDEEIKIDSGDIKVLKINMNTKSDLEEGEEEEDLKLTETFNFDNLEENKNDDISITTNDLNDLKQISLETYEDPFKKIDYKNLPLNRLKEIVAEKKINVDVKKLKKNEILKILGEE
jgi:hypothetical protein